MENESNTKVTINGIVGIIFFILIAILFVTITGGILRLLYSWVPLILFAGALLVNYKTVLKYARFLINRFKTNAMQGVAALILTVIFYPFVAAFLLGKAFLDRKITRMNLPHREQDQFVDYEEVTDEAEALDLKPLSKADPDNPYDDFLEEEPK